MDNRIIMLIMSLTTFLAYPFLSGDDRKQVSPIALFRADDRLRNSGEDDPDEDELYNEEEYSDDDEAVMMDEDDDEESP